VRPRPISDSEAAPTRSAPAVVADASEALRRLVSPRAPVHTFEVLGEVLNRSRRFLAYAVPTACAFVASQMWFVSGRFIASGDIPPFIRDTHFHEIGSLWGHLITGSGGPSYEIVRLPEMTILKAVDLLGGTEIFAQRLFFAIVMVWLAMSATYFIFGITRNPVTAALGGLLVIFNPFLLQSVPNILAPWTLAVMATTGGLVIRAARNHGDSALALALASLTTCYIALNPPLVGIALAWLLFLVAISPLLGGTGALRRCSLYVLRAAPIAIVLNLWWLFPLFFTLTSADNGLVFAAQTDVSDWAWTHARNSLANVTTMSGHWGWNNPEYFPYAAELDALPWGLMKFGLPAAALIAPLVAGKGRRLLASVLFIATLFLIFLSKGLHEPLSSANLWLYQNVPGMWLLREPSSKLGFVMVFLYSLLFSLAIQGAWRLWKKKGTIISQISLGLILVAGLVTLIFPHPLWTGKVIPTERPLLPSARVQIPQEWSDIAAEINRSTTPGKVLVLPTNDYYQIPTTWGYYGLDVVPRWLLARATIQFFPEGYFSEIPVFASHVYGVENAIRRGDEEGVRKLLEVLGVSHVIVRHDIDEEFRETIRSSVGLENYLPAMPFLELSSSTNVANVYEVVGRSSVLRTTTKIVHVHSSNPAVVSSVVSMQPEDVVVVQSANESISESNTDVSTTRPPTLEWIQTSPSSFEVLVGAAESDFSLILAESFAPGWRVDGVQSERVVDHFRADGFSNGWLFKAGGPTRLSVRYGPETWSRATQLVSSAGFLTVLLLLGKRYPATRRVMDRFRRR
jgi:arabinofuranan 3-O-arabinosyltransferase